MVFTRDELTSWLLNIALNNYGNELGRSCEELVDRLDGFETYVKEGRIFKPKEECDRWHERSHMKNRS